MRRCFFVQIPWELVASFAVGLGLLCLIGYLLLVPMRFMWRLAAGGVMGALALGLVNLLGSLVGFSVEINPFTAMAVGFLGLPGAGMVIVLQLLSLKECFGPSDNWTPHTTMLIDEPETVFRAVPIVSEGFKAFRGQVTSLNLYEFWPTRKVFSMPLNAENEG